MSAHISAKPGEIADFVLLPGDPLRAKFIAGKFLEGAKCYSEVRGMLGFTGKYKGKTVSVQGTGMGIPSASIYIHELLQDYKAKTLIRVGSCGALQPSLKLRDIVLASTACTDSSFNRLRFHGMDYSPVADFQLLKKADALAGGLKISTTVGSVVSSDNYYDSNPERWKLWAEYGALAIEMESTALYTLAAKFKSRALSVLTVSDSLVTHEAETTEAREKSYLQMVEIALGLAG